MNLIKKKISKKIICLLIIITSFITFLSISKSNDSIIIYSCMENFRNEQLQEQLSKEFPDLDIYVIYMPTAKIAAKLTIEGTETDADIIVDLEEAYMNKILDKMADVSPYSKLEYLVDAKSKNNKYITWTRQSGSIIINKDILEKHHLEIPTSYEDLLKPEYKNLIAMPDPKSSGTGFFFLKNLINEIGENDAFDYFDKLSINIKQFTESGSGPVKLLIQGEIAIGLGLTFQAVNEYNNGNDFIILEPEYGSPYSLTCTSMVEGRQTNPDIIKVFEFIANDYMVYDKTYNSPEKVLKNQINKVKNYPADIKYGNMAGIDDLTEKERILSKWKY